MEYGLFVESLPYTDIETVFLITWWIIS
jgi:hypothetical protein